MDKDCTAYPKDIPLSRSYSLTLSPSARLPYWISVIIVNDQVSIILHNHFLSTAIMNVGSPQYTSYAAVNDKIPVFLKCSASPNVSPVSKGVRSPDSSPRPSAVDDQIPICLHGHPDLPVSGVQGLSCPQDGVASSTAVVATVTSASTVTARHDTDKNC